MTMFFLDRCCSLSAAGVAKSKTVRLWLTSPENMLEQVEVTFDKFDMVDNGRIRIIRMEGSGIEIPGVNGVGSKVGTERKIRFTGQSVVETGAGWLDVTYVDA
jgi:hypothetical protein